MTNFSIDTNVITGAVTSKEWTPEETAARETRLASMRQVPEKITPRQVRLLLLQKGMLQNVLTLIATQDEATRITWEYATEFQRNNPLLKSLATSLNITDQQLDQFFFEASEL